MRKKLLLSLIAVVLGALLPVAAQKTVFDGDTTSQHVPIYGYYADAFLKCEYVIPASELTDLVDGTISSLKWYVSSPATSSWGNANFVVFLKEVDYTTPSGYSGTDGAAVVYEGSIDGTQSEISISFATPYHYSGGNLLVGVYNTEKGTYKSISFYGAKATGVAVQGYNYDSLDNVGAGVHNFGPKTTLSYVPAGAIYVAPPTDLTVSNITPNGATFSWTSDADISSWNVEYKLSSNDQWTQVQVSSASYTIDDADPGYEYDFRVQAVKSGSTSDWVETKFLAPYCEASDQGTIEYALTDAYGDSWNGNKIKVVNSITGTVVATLACPTGVKYANDAWETGTLNLCYGVQYDFVWVKGSYTDEVVFKFTDPLENDVIFNCAQNDADNYVDGAVLFSYTLEKELYPRPDSLIVDALAYNSASLSWTPKGEETAWQIAYGVGDIDPDSQEALLVTVDDGVPSYTLPSLDDATTYTAYVRADLGAATSRWSKPVTFTTPEQYPSPASVTVDQITNTSANVTWDEESINGDYLDAYSYSLRYAPIVAILSEDFQTDDVPSGWTVLDEDGDGYTWMMFANSGSDTDGNPYNFDGSCIESGSYINNVGALRPDNWLITPKVELGGTLTFYARAMDPGYLDDKVAVYVSTTGTDVDDFVQLPGAVICPFEDKLTQYVYDLSAYSGEGYIAFRHYDSYDVYRVVIDNLRVFKKVEDEEWTVEPEVSQPHVLGPGLESSSEYMVQVCANYNNGTASSRWRSAVFSTLSDFTIPSDLTITDIKGNSAVAEWEGVQDTYNLRYRTHMVGFFDDFEEGDGLGSWWTIIDNDGDGSKWLKGYGDADSNGNAYVEGTYGGLSWSNNNGTPIANVDNWLVSPQIELGGTFKILARGVSADNGKENFEVYLSTTGNDVDSLMAGDMILSVETDSLLTEYTVDLRGYAGEFGYIGIRHTGGAYGLIIDNFTVELVPTGEWVVATDVTSPAKIQSLKPSTKYDVQVQGIFDGDVTDWCDIVEFTTGDKIPGDMDGNGRLEVNDVVVLAGIAMGGSSDGYDLDLADLDGSGSIDVNDVVILAGMVMGS